MAALVEAVAVTRSYRSSMCDRDQGFINGYTGKPCTALRNNSRQKGVRAVDNCATILKQTMKYRVIAQSLERSCRCCRRHLFSVSPCGTQLDASRFLKLTNNAVKATCTPRVMDKSVLKRLRIFVRVETWNRKRDREVLSCLLNRWTVEICEVERKRQDLISILYQYRHPK